MTPVITIVRLPICKYTFFFFLETSWTARGYPKNNTVRTIKKYLCVVRTVTEEEDKKKTSYKSKTETFVG